MPLIKKMFATVMTILVVQTSAFTGGSGAARAAQIVGDAGRGEEITAKWCVTCHLLNGPSGADTAPTLRNISAKGAQSPGFLRSFLAQPHKPMPPLQLSNQNIEDIVAYFADLSRQKKPR